MLAVYIPMYSQKWGDPKYLGTEGIQRCRVGRSKKVTANTFCTCRDDTVDCVSYLFCQFVSIASDAPLGSWTVSYASLETSWNPIWSVMSVPPYSSSLWLTSVFSEQLTPLVLVHNLILLLKCFNLQGQEPMFYNFVALSTKYSVKKPPKYLLNWILPSMVNASVFPSLLKYNFMRAEIVLFIARPSVARTGPDT